MLPLADWPLLQGLVEDSLVQRNRVDAWFAEHPLDAPKLRGPIIIAGAYRTGTTFLHRALAPHFRTLAGWESQIPTPDQNPAVLQVESQAGIDALWSLDPELAEMHVEGAFLPAECVRAMAMTGLTGLWPAISDCPEYRDYLLSTSALDAYRFYDHCLRLLDPDRQWLLKAPMHSLFLEDIAEVWPDAVVLAIRRDPAETQESAVRFFTHLHRLSRPGFDPVHIERWVGPYLAEHVRRVAASPLPVLHFTSTGLREAASA
jgi:hypothetical protein